MCYTRPPWSSFTPHHHQRLAPELWRLRHRQVLHNLIIYGLNHQIQVLTYLSLVVAQYVQPGATKSTELEHGQVQPARKLGGCTAGSTYPPSSIRDLPPPCTLHRLHTNRTHRAKTHFITGNDCAISPVGPPCCSRAQIYTQFQHSP